MAGLRDILHSFEHDLLKQSVTENREEEHDPGVTRLTIEQARVGMGRDSEQVQNVYQSYEAASHCFYELVAAEAVAQISRDLHSKRIINGAPGDPHLGRTLKLTASQLPGTSDMYALTVRSKATSRQVIQREWRRGIAMVLRFDLKLLSEAGLCGRARVSTSGDSRKRRTPEQTLPPLPANLLLSTCRFVYRIALVHDESTVAVCLPMAAEGIKEQYLSGWFARLFDNGEKERSSSGYELPSDCAKFSLGSVDLSPVLRQADALTVVASAPDAIKQYITDPRFSWQWDCQDTVQSAAPLPGPPGSGKTTTIVDVITCCVESFCARRASNGAGIHLGESRPRFLVTAPTNDAVDELVNRLVDDEKFLHASKRLYDFAKKDEAIHGDVGYSSSVARFLRACSVVRIGRRSTDTREAVKEKCSNSIISAVRRSVVESRDIATGEIDRLERVLCDIAKRDGAIKCLSKELGKVLDGNKACEIHHMVVDEQEGSVRGDIATAVMKMKADIRQLDLQKEAVSARRDKLKADLVDMKSSFTEFWPADDSGSSSARSNPHTLRRVVENALCVFATCDGAAELRFGDAAQPFDLVIIDEAARATIPQLLVPIAAATTPSTSSGRHQKVFDVCVVGDPAQSSATIISRDPIVQEKLGDSILERAARLSEIDNSAKKSCSRVFRLHMLDKQFRMHPGISEFARKRFYGGALQDGRDTSWFALPWHVTPGSPRVAQQIRWYGAAPAADHSDMRIGPLLLIDTSDSEGEGRHSRYSSQTLLNSHEGSCGNLGEAFLLVKFLSVLCVRLSRHRELNDGSWCDLPGGKDRKPTVLVMAPYKLQVDMIRDLLDVDWRGMECEDYRRTALAAYAWQNLDSNVRESFFSELGDMETRIKDVVDFFHIDVRTVDSSLGREVDFAFFCRVAGNSATASFLSCPKRLCVALTRASALLVVVGSCKSEPGGCLTAWDEFGKHCKEKRVRWPVSVVEKDLNTCLRLFP